jgi:hypothetical protein
LGVLGIVALTGVLLAGGGIALSRRSKHRVDELRANARRLGWGFREDVPFEAIPDLERFELFRPGRHKKLSNLLTSPAGDPRAVIFDYAYTTGAGNSQRRHRQTVLYVTGDRLDLPSFSLRPENFFHRVGAMLGYQDIDLERRPEFSRLFLLRGDDEAAVRSAFTDVVAEFFERHPGTCAAGLGRELLFWRARRRIDPGELDTLIGDGFELTRRFADRPRT